jgi:hypothetical protein
MRHRRATQEAAHRPQEDRGSRMLLAAYDNAGLSSKPPAKATPPKSTPPAAPAAAATAVQCGCVRAPHGQHPTQK